MKAAVLDHAKVIDKGFGFIISRIRRPPGAGGRRLNSRGRLAAKNL